MLSQWEGALSHDGHGIIHHIEVFHCQLPADQVPVQFDQKAPSMSERPKGLESCRNVLGAWAMGAPVILVCTGTTLNVFKYCLIYSKTTEFIYLLCIILRSR